MDDWKVQFSKKVGSDMWNFRGDTVYEVKEMMKEALGEAGPKASPGPGAEDAVAPVEAAPEAAPDQAPQTPLEKARAAMAAKKEA